MSSMPAPTCGNQSDTSMPLWPCFLKVRFEASSLFLSTPRRVFTGPNDAGSFSPCRRVSSGLGSKVSTCDGPPDMNRKMTRFAFGSKCGFLGASGSTGFSSASNPSSPSIAASASAPNPHPALRRKARRSGEKGVMRGSLTSVLAVAQLTDARQQQQTCDDSDDRQSSPHISRLIAPVLLRQPQQCATDDSEDSGRHPEHGKDNPNLQLLPRQDGNRGGGNRSKEKYSKRVPNEKPR